MMSITKLAALALSWIAPAALLSAQEGSPALALGVTRADDSVAVGPLTWETLPAWLEAEQVAGFSGSVLAVRDGEVVLDRGFGFADPAGEHPITPATLFAIGSTPIDFTHGAILELAEMGKVSLDDPITRYFTGVPADKRGITLDHLRTSRSGLIDFQGIEGVDPNLDLSWIDRDEFLRRMFAAPLHFAPGTDEQHSHGAWSMLAAVIEVASGQDYETFLREHFFEPAGMARTGHYPLAQRFPAAEVAVGLGGNAWGEVNSPAYWGETSWLVLGSGGQISTTGDTGRWIDAMREGRILEPEWARALLRARAGRQPQRRRLRLRDVRLSGADGRVLRRPPHQRQRPRAGR